MGVELFAAAFVTGTTLAALAGNAAEFLARAPARLDAPFVDVHAPVRSIARMMVAGPYFLAGEAVAARRDGRCGLVGWFAAVAFIAAWCFASGIVGLELGWQIMQLASAWLHTQGAMP